MQPYFSSRRRRRSRPAGKKFAPFVRCVAPAFLLSAIGASPAVAMPQPGAPRLLKLAFPRETAPLSTPRVLGGDGGIVGEYSLRGARVQNVDGETALIFTRDDTARGGTRNVWRAPLGSEYSREDAAKSDNGTFGLGALLLRRSAPFAATPLTRLPAPFFADEAAPLPGQNALLCTTNFDPQNAARDENAPPQSRIARLDLKSGRLIPLTPRGLSCSSPAVAPSGARFAFVMTLESSGAPAVCVANLNGGGNFTYRRVTAFARSPRWLDDETLLVASTRSGGLRRVRVSTSGSSDDDSRQLFSRPGDSAVSPDGHLIFVAPQTPDSLFWMAADGAGAQRLASSEEAASPAFAPDGSALFYDAPADAESAASTRSQAANANSEDAGAQTSNAETANAETANADSARGLWFAPMRRIAPTALLLDVRPNGAAPRRLANATDAPILNVVGTAFSAGDDAPQIRLEWGDGAAPTQWNALPTSAAPIHAAPLAQWNLPAQTRGEKTLRLTVIDAFGDRAQSLLTLSFPLEGAAETPRLAALPTDAPPTDASTRASENRDRSRENRAVAAPPIAILNASGAPRDSANTRAAQAPEISRNATRNSTTPSGNASATLPEKPRFRIAPARDINEAISELPPPAPRPDAQAILDARRAVLNSSPKREAPDNRAASSEIVLPEITPAAPPLLDETDDGNGFGDEVLAPAVPMPNRREPKRRASTRNAEKTRGVDRNRDSDNAPDATATRNRDLRNRDLRNRDLRNRDTRNRDLRNSAARSDERGGASGARNVDARGSQNRRNGAPQISAPDDILPDAGDLPLFPAPLPRTASSSRDIAIEKTRVAALPREENDARRENTEPRVKVASRAGVSSSANASSSAPPSRVAFIGRRDDAATLSVAAIPASLKTGETLSLDVTARNNGKADWNSESEAPVRLVALWFSEGGGRRNGYRIRWVRDTISSGDTTRLTADLAAPSRAGKYFLVLAMARLNGTDYQPPRDYAALKNASGNGHFGARTFRVTVR